MIGADNCRCGVPKSVCNNTIVPIILYSEMVTMVYIHVWVHQVEMRA